MACNEESLQALDRLMAEFFDANTGNPRKRQIEELLENFSQQKDAWSHCLLFMTHTRSELVMMYCLTVLENTINRQWLGLDAQHKLQIRSTLSTFLMAHHNNVPPYIRNKLIKLIVNIGRLSWPHFYPDFFSSILQLLQQQETVLLGLIMLHTTSEELACPREDLSISRKQELHQLLLAQVPGALNLLNALLESILQKHRSFVSATPPPSPTHRSVTQMETANPLISTSPKPGILRNMFRSPGSVIHSEALPPLDVQTQQIAVAGLQCLIHLFSWIPLSANISPRLLSTIFHFAAFGCEISPGLADKSTDSNQALGILAMGCINELLSKNCVPTEFEDYLLQLFQQTFYLLQRITRDSTSTASGNRLTQLDESYVNKFTEFLQLFVSLHLRRFESNANFPVLDFLELLFKYTFEQPAHEGYYNCLEIWIVFLDYLCTKTATRDGEGDNFLLKYKDALVSLTHGVLKKIQFKHNQSQLDELDDENLDDDRSTEWQNFLRQNLEAIAKVAELIPMETFRMICDWFTEGEGIYLELEKHVTAIPASNYRQLAVTAENDSRRLHCALRDLASAMQALGRLAEHFVAEKFSQNFRDALIIVERFTNLASYGTRMKFNTLYHLVPVLKTDLVEVHSQCFAALKAYATWISQYYVECSGPEHQWHKCNSLISTLLEAIIPMFTMEMPEKIVQSGAHLNLTIFTTVCPSFIWRLPLVTEFYNSVSTGAIDGLPTEVQILLVRSLSHYLLLPWPNTQDSEQQWDSRGVQHSAFLQALMSDYIQLAPGQRVDKVVLLQGRGIIKHRLRTLCDLVVTISEQGVAVSKKLCYQSIQPMVHTTLTIFTHCMDQPDIADEVLSFFLALFQGLRVQMGTSFIEQTIHTFLGLFTQQQLSQAIEQGTGVAHKVVEKFLKILQFTVQEPGQQFKCFVPTVLTICMQQIYPLIADKPSPDLKPGLYEVLFQLLFNNWKYFFKSTALSLVNEQQEIVDNQQQFKEIMQAFGQAFLQPDIEVFRYNLQALEKLNEERKLYSKKIFHDVMAPQFLTVLLQVLLIKSHDLLADETLVTMYHMAAMDFEAFFGSFLPQFVGGCDGLDSSQKSHLLGQFKQDLDLPSFTQNIQRLVNDLRYYQLINTSLPAGSVRL